MGWIKDLFGRLIRPAGADPHGLWVYARCDRCGEALRARVDLRHDLSPHYGADERVASYFCRKTLIGSGPCFQPVEVELTFDKHRRLIEQEIDGGTFIEAEAFEAEKGA
jgi:hypothetical protein